MKTKISEIKENRYWKSLTYLRLELMMLFRKTSNFLGLLFSGLFEAEFDTYIHQNTSKIYIKHTSETVVLTFLDKGYNNDWKQYILNYICE